MNTYSGGDLVTAAIPAYNSERFLKEAIISVFDQTYEPIECIVVDDGSTDGTGDVAKSFDDVRYIRQENGGTASARNRAIAEASGTHIAFLDADDVWLPQKLELQMRMFIQRPNLTMVYTGVQIVDQNLQPGEILTPAAGEIALRNTLLVEKPYMTGIGSTGAVVTRVAREIGFDERLGPSADWSFACRVALGYAVEGIREPLALYRHHDSSQLHRDLAAVEHDMLLTWDELFEDPRLDPKLLRRRRAEANLYISLAARYFKTGNRKQFLRCLAEASIRRPDRLLAALWRRYMGPAEAIASGRPHD